jgi:hypothetical protein
MCRRAIINLPIDVASKNPAFGTPLTDCYPLYLTLLTKCKTNTDLENLLFAGTADCLRRSICPILSTIANKRSTPTGSTDTLRATFILIGKQMKGGIPTDTNRLDDLLGRIAILGQKSNVLGEIGKVCAFPPLPAGIGCHAIMLQSFVMVGRLNCCEQYNAV